MLVEYCLACDGQRPHGQRPVQLEALVYPLLHREPRYMKSPLQSGCQVDKLQGVETDLV